MSGVCGASDDYKFGDIIVAKQILYFSKRKDFRCYAKR